MNLLMIIGSVLLTATSQILFKIGMKGFNYEGAKDFILFLIKNPYVLSGLLLMGGGALLWFYVLSKNDVSFAYPFVSISFVVVFVAGYFLGEQFNVWKIIGIFLILGGLFFISRS